MMRVSFPRLTASPADCLTHRPFCALQWGDQPDRRQPLNRTGWLTGHPICAYNGGTHPTGL